MELNIEQICTIKVHKKLVYPWYEYKESRRFFIFWKTIPGFYYILGENTYRTNEYIEDNSNLYCEGKHVFYKPHIDFTMNNGKGYTEFFDDVKSLENFMKFSLSKIKTITIQ